MENPFDEINQRLVKIENLILANNKTNSTASITETEPFIDIKEASEFLGEAIPTIYGRTSRLDIPFYKRGKKLYFKKSELTEWVEKGKSKTKDALRQELRIVSRK